MWGMPHLTLRRLRWIAILSSLGFIALLELVRQAIYPILTTWSGRLFMDTTVFVGALFFFGAVFHLAQRLQQRLERQNRELLALHAAALAVHAELGLEAVLQRVVDQARALVDARYGAISVVDDRHRIETFLTSGITPEEHAAIGQPPVGRSLAVPIDCQGPHSGNLHLTEKVSAAEFSAEDEQSLVRFATTAAIAIDNAHLHQKLSRLAVAEERLCIAHEMHDGLAQVLAYVNTKAQAVREFLKTGRTVQAEQQLEQLAAAAREVYADVRESIIGLRTAAGGTARWPRRWRRTSPPGRARPGSTAVSTPTPRCACRRSPSCSSCASCRRASPTCASTLARSTPRCGSRAPTAGSPSR